METGAAKDASVKTENMASELIVTKEMEEVEQHLMAEGEKKEKEMMDKAQQSLNRESHEIRFKRLQHLLQKSNIYSKFLLTKMEQQQNEEKIKMEKLEKKAKKGANSTGPGKGRCLFIYWGGMAQCLSGCLPPMRLWV
ncbi:lymphoid-specific helicase-like isoform X2 [Vanacampus margaritifer]